MGGCTDPDKTGCHEAGSTGILPTLADPSQTLSRLLDQQHPAPDGCGQVWIKKGSKNPKDSFLYRRLSENNDGSEEDCEVQMPLMETPLDTATLECVAAWVVWVANRS